MGIILKTDGFTLQLAGLNEEKFFDIDHVFCDFDSFLINELSDFNKNEMAGDVIDILATRTAGWVEVFGFNAEEIHDEIDASSVRHGRQKEIGDGVPMTAWHDDMGESDIFNYILSGGHGYCDLKMVFICGSNSQANGFWERLVRFAAHKNSDT